MRPRIIIILVSVWLASCGIPQYNPHSKTSSHWDAWITGAVKTSIWASSELRVQDVQVTSIGGQVYLSGMVKNRQQAKQAVAIAESVAGVRGVTSKLITVLP